jgi:inositol hexakisphosphate/diphosphoinositol-pentakisphosphate kinase
MDKKARSKPMKEILHRLDPTLFEPVYFGDEMILNMPVESWPIVDVLIAFYSNGYPLEKAEDYVSLRRPYLLNCLATQRTLMDRRRVYDLLEECGIDVPRHVFVSRDGYVSTGTGDGKPIPSTSQRPSMRPGGVDAALNAVASSAAFAPSGVTTCDAPSSIGTSTNTASIINNTVSTALSSTLYGANKKNSPNPEYVEPIVDEHDDHIEVNGVTIHKPFVEKPVDADDHNIAIYYPSSAGGGCKKLFRKVGDRSSEFYPEINEIRRDGSYIYEEFMETQGVDVKMYTGEHAAHRAMKQISHVIEKSVLLSFRFVLTHSWP